MSCFTYSRLGFIHKCLTKIKRHMKQNVIKNNLKNRFNWNYYYFNILDENGNIVESFDLLIDAKLYIDKHKNYFIQKCHNISYIM